MGLTDPAETHSPSVELVARAAASSGWLDQTACSLTWLWEGLSLKTKE